MIIATVPGNLGQDAELRYTAGGDPVLNFSVASTTKIKDVEQTTWVRCSLFGKRGEGLAKYLTKGSKVTVSGTLSVREFEGKNGKGFSVDLRVNEVALQGGGAGGKASSAQARPAAAERSAQAPAVPSDEPEWNTGTGEDEIPF